MDPFHVSKEQHRLSLYCVFNMTLPKLCVALATTRDTGPQAGSHYRRAKGRVEPYAQLEEEDRPTLEEEEEE